MDTIQFDQIPASIRKPGKYFEFNTRLAVRTLPNNLQQMLIIAQRLAAGTVAELTPTRVYSDAEAAALFGNGSQAHLMVRAAIKANPYLQLTVCALDDAGTGVASTGAILFAGTASGNGSVSVWIGNHLVEVGVLSGDTAAEVNTALLAELAKHPDLPLSSAVNGAAAGQTDFTAKNAGVVANQIGIAVQVTAAGITAAVTAMNAGAVDPDIQDALDVVFAEQYHIIATPFNDATSIGALRDHLDSVAGPLEQRPGRGVYGFVGALGSATSLATGINGGRINAPFLRGTRSPAYEIAAAYAAILAGEEDPARPLNTLYLAGIHAPAVDQRLSRTEQETCLYNGVAPLEVGPGEKVQIVRAVTTYVQDAQAVADISLLDTTTIATLDYVRKACRERVALRFPREKLNSRTPKKVRSELLDVLKKLEDLEIVEEVDANADALIVQRSLQDPNRLDAKIPADVVNGLHVFAGRIDLLL
ncbi:MAG: phage tail sheath subtilisin-like domain-containing protein [Desulfobacterales bacterium]|nr:phage tail sheath subtilisin-like domain-containing protein [Desulfobacterales bacterium]